MVIGKQGINFKTERRQVMTDALTAVQGKQWLWINRKANFYGSDGIIKSQHLSNYVVGSISRE